MTADEQEAKDIADAQEAKDIADAQAAKQAEIDAAAGITGGVTSGGELLGAGKSFVRGVGRGFASLPDAPAAVYTGVKNIPSASSTLLAASARSRTTITATRRLPSSCSPTGPAQPLTYPQAPSKDDQLPLDTAPKTPISQAYDTIFPVDPNHPCADVTGAVAGPAIVEAIGSGGGSLLRFPARSTRRDGAAATTGGTLDRERGRRGSGPLLGGSGDIGSVSAGVGGGLAPGIVTQAGWKGLNTAFTDSSSAARLAAVKKLNEIPGVNIPESLGLVGNKFAGQVEDATAAVPFGGGSAYKAREAQHLNMDTAAREIANQMRGGPADVRGVNPVHHRRQSQRSFGCRRHQRRDCPERRAEPALRAGWTGRADRPDRATRGNGTHPLGVRTEYRLPVETEINPRQQLRDSIRKRPREVVDPGLEAQLQMQAEPSAA